MISLYMSKDEEVVLQSYSKITLIGAMRTNGTYYVSGYWSPIFEDGLSMSLENFQDYFYEKYIDYFPVSEHAGLSLNKLKRIFGINPYTFRPFFQDTFEKVRIENISCCSCV